MNSSSDSSSNVNDSSDFSKSSKEQTKKSPSNENKPPENQENNNSSKSSSLALSKKESEKQTQEKNNQTPETKNKNDNKNNPNVITETEVFKNNNTNKNSSKQITIINNKTIVTTNINTINTVINNQINFITGFTNKNLLENMLLQQDKFITFMKDFFIRVLSSNSNEQNFQKIHENIKGNEHKFEDELFPANHINSLLKGYKKQNSKNNLNFDFLKEYKNITWKRESEINDFDKIFPRDNILLNQIVASKASNPNLISVLNAISNDCERIKKLFIQDKKDYSAIFGVKICKNGELKETVIDDFFPVWKNSKKYIFSKEKKGYLWVQILEKSYAKLYGSYYLIYEIPTENILKDFTYAPVITYDRDMENSFKNILLEANKNGWIMMGGAGNTPASENLLEEVGLKSNSDYEIVEIFVLSEKDIKDITEKSLSVPNNEDYKIILKIRNIWGNIKWVGDWSEYSTGLWTEHYKQLLKKCDDQCFYMNLIDFKSIFSKIKICKYHKNFLYSSILVKQISEKYCLISMKIKNNNNEGKYKAYISFIQENKSNKKDKKYNLGRFILCKKEDQNYNYIKGQMGKEREIIMETVLNLNNEYLIFTQIENITKPTNYIISVYSNAEIELEEIQIPQNFNILQKIYTNLAKNSQNLEKIDKKLECYKKTDNTSEGYTYIYIQNKEEDATFIEDVKYTKFEGLKLLSPFSGTGYHVEVGPGEEQIILIKHLEMNEYKLIFSYQSNFLFGKNTLKKLTKQSDKFKKRMDKKTKKEVDIIVYTYKHSFGICFLYENNTDDKKLREKINISNNTNIEFDGQPEGTTEMVIKLEPHKTQFVQLKSKNALWKVQPLISYNVYDMDKET